MRRLPFASGRRVAVLACGLVLVSLVAARADEMRTWKDGSGKFTIKAKLVKVEGGKVTLEQEDGEEIEIEVKKLSAADQKYVADKGKEEQDNPFKKAPKSNPFKAKTPKGKTPKAKTAGTGAAGLTKPDWSKARAVVLAPASDEWKVTVGTAKVPAEVKVRPIGLPPKANFFERTKGLAVSADGRRAAVGYNMDEPRPEGVTRLVLCDLEKGQTLGAATSPGLMAPLAVSDDGNQVLMRKDVFGFGNSDQLEMWTVSDSGIEKGLSFAPYGDQNGGDRDVKWAAFLDAKRLATVNTAGKLVVWDLDKPRPIYYVGIQRDCVPALSPDRKLLAFTTGKEVGILDVDDGAVVAMRATPNTPFPALSFSPSGKRLALVAFDRIWSWDVATGALYREMLLTGIHVNGQMFWTDEEHALVAGQFLLDLENQVRLWAYQGAEQAARAGDVCLFAVANGTNGPGALIPAKLPQPGALATLKKAMADPNFFILKPGTAVKVDVSGLADPPERDKAAAALAEKLTKNGEQVGPNGTVTLVASTEVGKERDVEYRTFGGGFGTRTYKIREHISRVKFVYQGKTAWETSAYNIPGMVMLKEGETMESFLRKQEKPNYAFFSGVDLPKTLTRPTGTPTLGTSQVSTSGVR